MDRRYFLRGTILAGAALVGLGFSKSDMLYEEHHEEDTAPQSKTELGKVLFAYYSLTGHTKGMTSRIRNFTGGDIFEIATRDAYNYSTIESVGREQVRTKFTPALRKHLTNTDYDVIFIGSPIWWFSMAPPVLTFLRETQLKNKIIVPFCTHDGNYGQYFDRIAEECPSATIIKGRDFQNAKSTNIPQLNQALTDWLAEIQQTLPVS